MAELQFIEVWAPKAALKDRWGAHRPVKELSGCIETNEEDGDAGPINGTGPVSIHEVRMVSSLIMAGISNHLLRCMRGQP